jgi:hypothetical protein
LGIESFWEGDDLGKNYSGQRGSDSGNIGIQLLESLVFEGGFSE